MSKIMLSKCKRGTKLKLRSGETATLFGENCGPSRREYPWIVRHSDGTTSSSTENGRYFHGGDAYAFDVVKILTPDAKPKAKPKAQPKA
jgi:hypothetical protein